VTMADKRLQVDAPPITVQWLAERAVTMNSSSLDDQACVELAVWHDVMLSELRNLRKTLTLAQACCLAEILRDIPVTSRLGRVAHTEARDTFATTRDSAAAKWGIDEKALLGLLWQLTPVADHALRDAIARWRQGGHEPTAEGFAAVGLVVTSTNGEHRDPGKP
jgi:hypothetical protein